MRTTIELDEEHRARLLELAARRELKGFSALVQEALDSYLERAPHVSQPSVIVDKFCGSISKEEADHMRAVAKRLRRSWRRRSPTRMR